MAENLKNAVSLYSEIVEVNGKHYKLQHPGNRAWLKLKQSLVNITTKEFDFEKHYKAGAVVFDTKAVVERQWVEGRL